MKRLLALVAAWAFSGFIVHSGSALAQMPDLTAKISSAAKDAFQTIKTEADKNKDGKISKDEFFTIYKDKNKAEKNFKAWDLNQDGYITEEEYVKSVTNIAKPRSS